MQKVISIGKQNFVSLRENDCFYIDKTDFIRQWWKNADDITLITRPRRFGKTLNMSMLNCFFSRQYAERGDLFEGLSIWEEEKYRELQGTYPVIFISFADVKQNNYEDAVQKIKNIIVDVYRQHRYLEQQECFSESEKQNILSVTEEMNDVTAQDALKNLSKYLKLLYGKKVLIFLDEYDTPMQEAYIHGYWDEFIGFMRGLFNAAFKTNPYLERAVMTGITRVSKESVFSDLNNLAVITTTSEQYADCFGFTEEEVFSALDAFGMSEKKQIVKQWYDGFIFGKQKDMYNPWSICNYMRSGELQSYWINTSSNKLIGEIIRRHPVRSKHEIEQLMAGEIIHKEINENVTFQYLDGDENSLWSLFLAVGYIKAENVVKQGESTWCDMSVTNREVMGMFRYEILAMFENGNAVYNDFTKALLSHRMEDLNDILLDIAYTSMSYFDVGKCPPERTSENFYRGLVLGLIVSLRDQYRIVSNRESGQGRYDIAMYPLERNKDAFIMEFKVFDAKKERSLEQTAANALKQIEEKNYEADLIAAGIGWGQIYKRYCSEVNL